MAGDHATDVRLVAGPGSPAWAACSCGWRHYAPGAPAAALACWAHHLAQPAPPAVAGHRPAPAPPDQEDPWPASAR